MSPSDSTQGHGVS
uniref:Uncharacterized protein n=1 Tax=Anguilla anguilla TaxID=7936 RepID=A0A0E9U1B8_ANGAN